jgi:hypothetical protein
MKTSVSFGVEIQCIDHWVVQCRGADIRSQKFELRDFVPRPDWRLIDMVFQSTRSLFSVLVFLFKRDLSSATDVRYSSSSSICSMQRSGRILTVLAGELSSCSASLIDSLHNCSTYYLTNERGDHFQILLKNHQVLTEHCLGVFVELTGLQFADLAAGRGDFVGDHCPKRLEQDIQEPLILHLLDDEWQGGQHPGVLGQPT